MLNHSNNGNLFHTRKFLSYHPQEKFVDASILLRKNKKIVAVVAANLTEDSFFSHGGTSCGGPILGVNRCGVGDAREIVKAVNSYYEGKLSMRLCENILGGPVNALLRYLLNEMYAIQPEISAYKQLTGIDNFIDSIPHKKTRSATRKCFRDGYKVKEANTELDYKEFHKLLACNLDGRHKTEPTHTLEELIQLRDILKDRQKLVLGRNADGNLCAATWLIAATAESWHTQYIARDYTQVIACAVEATLCGAMEIVRDLGAKYLNLGICTENGGTVLNTGLLRFKESLGCIHHNRYLLTPKP